MTNNTEYILKLETKLKDQENIISQFQKDAKASIQVFNQQKKTIERLTSDNQTLTDWQERLTQANSQLKEQAKVKNKQIKELNQEKKNWETQLAQEQNTILKIMNKNKLSLFWLSEFENESELQSLLKKNLNRIFSKLHFLSKEWHIPNQKKHSKAGRIDILAFQEKTKDKWGSVVIIECKHKDKIDPLTQVKRYLSYSKSDIGNAYKLMRTYNEFLAKQNRSTIDWEIKSSNHEKIWDNSILICIAPFGHFEINHYDYASESRIILVEVRKYENSENELFIFSLATDFPKLKREWSEWKKKLGMPKESIAIILPKPKETIANKTQELPKKSKQIKQKIPATETTNQINLERFLNAIKAEPWFEKVKEIDVFIRSLDTSITQKPSPTNKCLAYYWKNYKPFLVIRPLTKEIKIFLRKMERQELTNNNWKPRDEKGSYFKKFDWKTTLKKDEKEKVKEILNSIKEYLERLKN